MNEKPRVPLLTEEEAVKRASEIGINEQMARLSVFRILLQHPPVAKCLSGTLSTLLFTDNKLDARLRELIIMRIGWVTAAEYEWTQHWRVAVGLKIPEDHLLAVRDWKNSTVLSDQDKAVLQATDEVLDQGVISDATWSQCVGFLSTAEERVELVVAIGNWTLFSQMLKSLKVPLEEEMEAWPPDGQIPPDV